MKRTIKFSILAVLLAITGSLSAHTMLNGGFKLSLLQTNKDNVDVYGGFYAGFSQNVILSRHVGVAPGIYFTRISGEKETPVAGVTTHSTLNENAIAIPVPLDVMIHITDVSCLYIYGGPEFNIGISSKSDYWVGDSETHLTTDFYEEGVNGELNRFNISWLAGVGAKFDFLNVNLGVGGNFFNRLYDSNDTQKAINVILGIGLAF